MRQLYPSCLPAIIWLMLMLSVHLLQAQSALNCCNGLPTTIPKMRFSNRGLWRLSAFGGPNYQLQRPVSDQFIRNGRGLQSGFATDYFLGRHWGVGAMFGYQTINLNNQTLNNPRIPIKEYNFIFSKIIVNSIDLSVGPVFMFPLTGKLLLDLGLRVGFQYNDGPFSGFNRSDFIEIMPDTRRINWGLNTYGNLLYRLTPRLQLGLGIRGSYTQLNYQVRYNDRLSILRPQLGISDSYTQLNYQAGVDDRLIVGLFRRLGILSGQVTVAYIIAPRRKNVPMPLPSCYPPVLNSQTPVHYEIARKERPQFKWQSGAPVYTENEQFTFQLYSVPGKTLLFEKKVTEPQISWPSNLALPDTNSLFIYSIYSSRRDDLEQSCQSEKVIGTLAFSSSNSKIALADSTESVLLELFELQNSTTPALKDTATYSEKQAKRILSAKGIGKKLAQHRLPVLLDTTIRKVLICREVSPKAAMRWPTDLGLPAKPMVYLYTVRQVNDSVKNVKPIFSTFILVDSTGKANIINNLQKVRYLSPVPAINKVWPVNGKSPKALGKSKEKPSNPDK